MMEWTDRFCRNFHRQFAPEALLYTEMLTTGALIHGDQQRHLRFDPAENPLALQLGGSDPEALARCAALGEQWGYNEINLNCGCPSDRVQNGSFGAVLMKDPELVAQCVADMKAATSLPITVKHRIGVDDLDGDEFLHNFVATVAAAGCEVFIVHARKAWLSGLSPRENREIPPLDYPSVHRLKQAFPELKFVLNGGIKTVDQALRHAESLDGVMIGREAYENPYFLAELHDALFESRQMETSRTRYLLNYLPFVEQELAAGTPLSRMSKHILGLFRGLPGGRIYRRVLSERAHKHHAGIDVIRQALAEVDEEDLYEAA